MREVVIKCDRCGKVIHDLPAKVSILRTQRTSDTKFDGVYEPDMELCLECVNKLIVLIDNFATARQRRKISFQELLGEEELDEVWGEPIDHD